MPVRTEFTITKNFIAGVLREGDRVSALWQTQFCFARINEGSSDIQFNYNEDFCRGACQEGL